MTAKQLALSKLHKRLWLWLARNPGKSKAMWPGWYTAQHARYKDEAKLWNHCFACYATLDRGSKFQAGERVCSLCPLDWGEAACNDSRRPCVAGLFGEWSSYREEYRRLTGMPCDIARATVLEPKLRKLARAIASMKWTPKRRHVHKPDNERY